MKPKPRTDPPPEDLPPEEGDRVLHLDENGVPHVYIEGGARNNNNVNGLSARGKRV